jgi:hypothetical protein
MAVQPNPVNPVNPVQKTVDRMKQTHWEKLQAGVK